MSPRSSRYLDRLGAAGSLACALHCAMLPLVIAVLPSLGLASLVSEWFERGFVVLASMIGLFSVVWSYRRHRAVRALSRLIPGLLLLWGGLLFRPLHEGPWLHALTMTLGGTLVGLAHLSNLRLNYRHVHNAQCAHGSSQLGASVLGFAASRVGEPSRRVVDSQVSQAAVDVGLPLQHDQSV